MASQFLFGGLHLTIIWVWLFIGTYISRGYNTFSLSAQKMHHDAW